jgi:hypothetical protein
MASQGRRPGTAPEGGREGGCQKLRAGCAGWYQARGCCVAAYAAGWLLPRGSAAAEGGDLAGGCPRFADPPAQAGLAVAEPPSQTRRPPSWLSSEGRSV